MDLGCRSSLLKGLFGDESAAVSGGCATCLVVADGVRGVSHCSSGDVAATCFWFWLQASCFEKAMCLIGGLHGHLRCA